jgi:hypothetical protein
MKITAKHTVQLGDRSTTVEVCIEAPDMEQQLMMPQSVDPKILLADYAVEMVTRHSRDEKGRED